MPLGPTTSVCRSVSRTPYENAAARVPPPENARMTRFWGSLACLTRVEY